MCLPRLVGQLVGELAELSGGEGSNQPAGTARRVVEIDVAEIAFRLASYEHFVDVAGAGVCLGLRDVGPSDGSQHDPKSCRCRKPHPRQEHPPFSQLASDGSYITRAHFVSDRCRSKTSTKGNGWSGSDAWRC